MARRRVPSGKMRFLSPTLLVLDIVQCDTCREAGAEVNLVQMLEVFPVTQVKHTPHCGELIMWKNNVLRVQNVAI